MSLLKAYKLVSALPSVLLADCIYFIRTGAGFDLKVTDATASIAHKLNLSTKIKAALTNSIVTGETVVASFAMPVNYLEQDDLLVKLLAQVSATATLTFRLRLGQAGTVADALLGQFATTAAGVVNGRVTGNILVANVGTNQYAAGGNMHLGNGVVGIAAAAFAAVTIDPAVANVLTVTVVQSAAQTYTSRFAALIKL